MAVFLDTNVIIWLATGHSRKLSRRAIDLVERSELQHSPMVLLELYFLQEIGRLKKTPDAIMQRVKEALLVNESQSDFSQLCDQAQGVSWTRDVFDRLIVAEAMLHGAPLVTGDAHILKHYAHAVA